MEIQEIYAEFCCAELLENSKLEDPEREDIIMDQK
jgi:hypothetical protein